MSSHDPTWFPWNRHLQVKYKYLDIVPPKPTMSLITLNHIFENYDITSSLFAVAVSAAHLHGGKYIKGHLLLIISTTCRWGSALSTKKQTARPHWRVSRSSSQLAFYQVSLLLQPNIRWAKRFMVKEKSKHSKQHASKYQEIGSYPGHTRTHT